MNISIQNRNLINQTYGKSRVPTASSKEAKGLGRGQDSTIKSFDSVSLSSTTQDLQKIERAMNAESPERAERVAALKASVEGGSYKVDPEKVAERMAGFYIDKIV